MGGCSFCILNITYLAVGFKCFQAENASGQEEYVAKQHNGKLVLNHSEEYGGARVELYCEKL